jgi:zinc and cadmium transporter
VTPAVLTLIFAAIAAALVIATLAGLRFAAGFTRAHSPTLAAFAAGLLLAIAVIHLIPEAMAGLTHAWVFVGAGLAVGFLIQQGLRRASGDAERAMAFAPVLAIAIHAALDGAMYAVMFASDSFSGVAGGAGLLLHKPADAAVCFILLQRAGVSDGRAALWSFLAAGFSTLAAAALAAPFAASLPPAMIAGFLGLVAGVLIHVSAAHLLGHARAVGGLRRAIPMVALGALAATGLTAAHHVGHDHGAHAHEAHDHDHDDHKGHGHALLDPAFAGPDFSPMGARTYRYASLTRASHGDPR